MKFAFSLTVLSLFSSAAVASNMRGSLDRKLTSDEPYCVNTAAYDLIDQGCDSLFPICAVDDHGFEPAAHVAGSTCAKCINDVDMDGMFNDMGCDGEYSQCEAPLGKAGKACYKPVVEPFVCKNTQAYGGLDEGCNNETPICINSGTGQEAPGGAEGDKCVACVKVYSQGYYDAKTGDFGCSADYPRCMAEDDTDVALLHTGAQCCKADGSCAPACPCNTPGSGWERTLAAVHPIPEVRICREYPQFGYSTLEWHRATGFAMATTLHLPQGPICAYWDWNSQSNSYRALRKSITAAESISCKKEIDEVKHAHYVDNGVCPK